MLRILLRICLLGLAILCVSGAANAQVVALGASNTAGKGVSSQDAYPAQLQGLLNIAKPARPLFEIGLQEIRHRIKP